MAFSFGTPAAAAPAPAAFGARSATPAFGAPPAPAFGAAPAAPAPAPAFGAAPAPAFGAPAAAPAFGAAPAPSTGLFGSPAPAPAFGAAPAAPSTSLFGAVGAAPVGGGFGGFGSPPAAAAPQPQQQQQPQASLAGHMSYASLPPNMKQVVDQLHDSMMRHKRSVAQLQTMGPQVLQPVATTSTNKSNAATTTTSTTVDTPLGQRLTTLASHLDTLRARHAQTRTRTDHQCTASEGAVVHATQYAQWRAEQLAVRAGVRVVTPADVAADRYGSHATTTTTTTTTTGGGGGAANTSTTATSKQHDDDLHRKIRQALDVSTAAVDRLDAVPSPYFWHVLHSLEARAQAVQDRIGPIMGSNNHSSHNSHKHTQLTVPPSLTDITNQYRKDPAAAAASSWNMVQQLDDTLEEQHVALVRLAADWRVRHDTVEGLRHRYHRYDRDTNVLVERDARLAQRDRQQREGVQRYLLEAAAPMAATTATTTAAPATGGLFGSAPATGGGLFGSAPATGGGLFGSAPAAAPVAGGGLFGSAPAAPATGGLFGSTPAPAAGGLFGSTPAPAPGGLFGAAAPPAPGGLFGSSSTPAPAFGAAPAAAGAFGAAPATPGGFGSAAPATTLLSSKKKSGTRGSRRR